MRSEIHSACHEAFGHGEEMGELTDRTLIIDFGNGEVQTLPIQDRFGEYKEWIRLIYEMGLEESAKITMTYCIHYANMMFDGDELKRARECKEDQIRHQMEKDSIIQAKFDEWQLGLDWAREHGAKIRKGKTSKYTVRVRIYEAGLMDQWNELFPNYAFTDKDVKDAQSILKERKEFYAQFKKRPKKK